MKDHRANIWSHACELCRVSRAKYPAESALIGWDEFASHLDLEKRGAQNALAPDALWLVKPRAKIHLIYAAIPPDEFAVLSTSLKEVIEYRDYKDSPDIWFCSPEQLRTLRANGGPVWERFVDLKKRYPQIKNVVDGELGLNPPTKARFFPVSLDTTWLDRRYRLRRLITSVQRSNAMNSRWRKPLPIYKMPNNEAIGALSYLSDDQYGNHIE